MLVAVASSVVVTAGRVVGTGVWVVVVATGGDVVTATSLVVVAPPDLSLPHALSRAPMTKRTEIWFRCMAPPSNSLSSMVRHLGSTTKSTTSPNDSASRPGRGKEVVVPMTIGSMHAMHRAAHLRYEVSSAIEGHSGTTTSTVAGRATCGRLA